VGILNAFLPMQDINKRLFKVKLDQPVAQSYFETYRYFTTVFYIIQFFKINNTFNIKLIGL